MGVPLREDDGWIRNQGLRVVGGGHRLELPWPELSSYPSFGLARTRMSLDHALAEHARAAGAKLLERTQVTGPVLDERTGRVVGVTARPVDDAGRRAGDAVEYRPPSSSPPTASRPAGPSLGLEKRIDRPIGVTVRTYFRTRGTTTVWIEEPPRAVGRRAGRSNLVPGYGSICSLGDGTTTSASAASPSTAARRRRSTTRTCSPKSIANAQRSSSPRPGAHARAAPAHGLQPRPLLRRAAHARRRLRPDRQPPTTQGMAYGSRPGGRRRRRGPPPRAGRPPAARAHNVSRMKRQRQVLPRSAA